MDHLSILFNTLLKIVVEVQYDARRLYNMDETNVLLLTRNSKVVALKGSQNVWSKIISTKFHLSVVACESASRHLITPLLFLTVGSSSNFMYCFYLA